jgi:acyl carrier protein phosphodiesterase
VNEEQIEKMLEELVSLRREQKDKIKGRIKDYEKMLGGLSFDFASLYPTMTMKFPTKQVRRKKKIKKIFHV